MTEHGLAGLQRAAFIAGYEAADGEWFGDRDAGAEEAWLRYTQDGRSFPPVSAFRVEALLGAGNLTTLTWPG